MSRAVLFVCLGLLAAPGVARAFHTGSTFNEAPGRGGGGGVFYTGAPTERGWTCAACHVLAPQEMQVTVRDDLGAFDAGTYTPGEVHQITVRIENERLGRSSTRSNFNGMALTVLADDPAGAAGSLSAGQGFFLLGRQTLATDSTTVGETEWTFRWTAPDAGAGRVTFYLGVVDGNGADAPPTSTLTDPYGDDVATGALSLQESGARAEVIAPLPEVRWSWLPKAMIRRREERARG